MCLSTVYQNEKTESAVLMKNVMAIQCTEDSVILTDLMDRQLTVSGKLSSANLVEGYVIVEAN